MPDCEALNHSLIRCHVVFYPHFNHVIGETTILNVPYITQSATEDDKTEPSQARDTDFLSRRWLGSELWSRENFRSTLRFINYMLYDSFNLMSVINKQLMNSWPLVCVMSIFLFGADTSTHKVCLNLAMQNIYIYFCIYSYFWNVNQ